MSVAHPHGVPTHTHRTHEHSYEHPYQHRSDSVVDRSDLTTPSQLHHKEGGTR